MDVSLESKSLPSVGYSRKSYLQVTSLRLVRGKLLHLNGWRSLALPSVGPAWRWFCNVVCSCEDGGMGCEMALMCQSKSNSEDVSSEDEWLGSLSLGVKKAGPTLGKASDLHPLRCTSLPLASLWEVINFVDFSCLRTTIKEHQLDTNQMAPLSGPLRGHELADTPIGNESNGTVTEDGATLHCACHIEYEIAEEAMNFLSYVAEVSRGWDEPKARDMGRMKSQLNAKGEIYILNDDIDMKAKIAAMARRLEDLEMKKMQEVQAISQTPLQAMPCAICLSYEHLVEKCPTIPVTREMFGDCNTYNSNWRDHPNFSWKPQPPQYQQPAQALSQASNLEQAMVNLSKVVGDFIGAQKSINAQLSQKLTV
ncbi:hypothetical protein CK203_052407 [Vitis vinifera]|uniref:Uncharacterized protein n=1 Tax=Vitis vinifera TaxID=29760 RepID=A0A438H6S2_VITVI|nr:hypothetical protein CK203_052407 [Vitis vinifera]